MSYSTGYHRSSGLGFDSMIGGSSSTAGATGGTYRFTIMRVCGLPSGRDAEVEQVIAQELLNALSATSRRARWISGGRVEVTYTVASSYLSNARRQEALRQALRDAARYLGPNVGFRLSDGTTVGRTAPCSSTTQVPRGLDVPAPTSISVRSLQQLLLQKGFSVGPSGADGRWGTNTEGALTSALGAPAGRSISAGATEVDIPTAELDRIRALPDRPVGTAQPSAPRPDVPEVPIEEPPVRDEAGEAAMQILPWAIGAVALLGIGGYFMWRSRRAPRYATANRRRR
jgi:hypothetical protein